jgi:hypothetical protein
MSTFFREGKVDGMREEDSTDWLQHLITSFHASYGKNFGGIDEAVDAEQEVYRGVEDEEEAGEAGDGWHLRYGYWLRVVGIADVVSVVVKAKLGLPGGHVGLATRWSNLASNVQHFQGYFSIPDSRYGSSHGVE